jgi:hypothetical protein
MAVLTMLDIAARTGNDSVIGLIEDVTTYSPEFATFPARTVKGVTYMLGRRVGLPSAGFRNANEGSATQKSAYVQDLKQLYFMDVQMAVDEAIVGADDRSVGDLLFDEGRAALQGAVNAIGSQTYYGITANAKGFAGLSTQISDDTVYAGGTTNTSSAYLVDLSLKGVHFVVGNDGQIAMPEWMKQRITDDAGNPYMAFVSNLASYIGLNVGSAYSVYRVRGIDASHSLTDALGAKCLAGVPLSRQSSGNLRWLMNRTARYTLQNSRSSVGQQSAGSGGSGAYAPMPTELCGIPIITTDALLATETTTAS